VDNFFVPINCDATKIWDWDTSATTETLLDQTLSINNILVLDWVDEKIRGKLECLLEVIYKNEHQETHYAINCGLAKSHLESNTIF
jgi:hypothetical protein